MAESKKPVQSQNERPIKFNPTGKYDMDFIDWENEYDRMGDFSEDSDEENLPDE